MKLTPDYAVTSHELFDAIRLLDREAAVRLIQAQLGAAFASGGIKALDMVKDEIDKLPAVPTSDDVIELYRAHRRGALA